MCACRCWMSSLVAVFLSFEIVSLTQPGADHVARLASQGASRIFPSLPPSMEITVKHSHARVLCGCWDPHSGRHVCPACPLSHLPCPQTLWFSFTDTSSSTYAITLEFVSNSSSVTHWLCELMEIREFSVAMYFLQKNHSNREDHAPASHMTNAIVGHQ